MDQVAHHFHDALTNPTRSWLLAKNDDGSASITGMHIFRAGGFRDSRGRQTEWTLTDITSMASNFDDLRGNSFPNVPVRRDHVRSVDNVIGYFDRVYVKGSDLFGDFTITEPDAVEKFERGTFRSRSIEIGPYESNTGDVTFPAVLGLAMVDIPAVEGLFQRFDPSEEINDMSQEELDWAIAAAYAQAIDDTTADHSTEIEWAVASGYAAADVEVRAEFAKSDDRAPFMFRLGDNDDTSDYTAVQRRLDALNTFYSEQTEKSRVDFIDELVTDHKIGAPQRDDLVEFARSLTPEQFSAFRSTYESAPKLGLLGDHGAGEGTGPEDSSSPLATELATARETVAFHARSGMSEAEIQETKSYQRMIELEAQLNKGDA